MRYARSSTVRSVEPKATTRIRSFDRYETTKVILAAPILAPYKRDSL